MNDFFLRMLVGNITAEFQAYPGCFAFSILLIILVYSVFSVDKSITNDNAVSVRKTLDFVSTSSSGVRHVN